MLCFSLREEELKIMKSNQFKIIIHEVSMKEGIFWTF